ncbi:MAG: hypothetical protein NW700_18335, partial [Nitrospiraceae bacterium]
MIGHDRPVRFRWPIGRIRCRVAPSATVIGRPFPSRKAESMHGNPAHPRHKVDHPLLFVNP